MNKGFTLIELLVVIWVVGILASFILTNLPKSESKTQVHKTERKEIREKYIFNWFNWTD